MTAVNSKDLSSLIVSQKANKTSKVMEMQTTLAAKHSQLNLNLEIYLCMFTIKGFMSFVVSIIS